MEYKIYFGIAIVSTVIFLTKLVLLMTVGDGADTEMDFHDDFDGSDSFDLLSVQSVMAFLMSFSWSVLAFRKEFGMEKAQAILVAVAVAFVMAYLFSYALFKLKKLSSEEVGDVQIPEDTVVEVYSNIPKKDKGYGQVKVLHHGKTYYLKAYSEDVEYKTKSLVKVSKSNPLTVKENK